MSTDVTPKSTWPGLKNRQRTQVAISDQALVKTESPFGPLPLVVRPALDGVDLISWAQSHKAELEKLLLNHGGLLFRGFKMTTAEDLHTLIQKVSGKLLSYSHRSTPRTHVANEVYTATEYPADLSIVLHNECSWTPSWPMKLWFFCVIPAEVGGETPICDSRKIYNRIAPKIRDRFAEKGVMYVRNYSQEMDLPWQEVFQTTDPAVAEAFCHKEGLAFEWRDKTHFRTRQVCQAMACHPVTGEAVWFNQAHLFHVSNLQSSGDNSIMKVFDEENLPRNAYYGDSSPIENTVLDEIRAIYEEESVYFPWQKGDVLLVDNMLTAHGRAPFKGQRKVLVGMSQPKV